MLTIFSIPKPFRGHFGVIQRNAIRSWILLRPACEVVLFGNDKGTAEIASEFGIQHIPDVECNEYGTPLVSSTFKAAQYIASHQLMCYVNADIMLMSDFLPAIGRVQKYPFLLVGQRWDIELNESVNFEDTQWETWLRTRVAEHGKLHPKYGIDYFVFPRELYDNIPPFAIGRPGWDNWMLYQARSLEVPVIDATKAITIVHQNHDYSHCVKGADGVWKGPEVLRNRELAGSDKYVFTLDHATWLLSTQGVKRALSLRYLYFRLDAVTVLSPRLHFLRRPMKMLTQVLIRICSMLSVNQN